MNFDVIIAGGGAAGLTAAAYTAQQDCSLLLIEKQEHLGGLVQSVSRNGFTFDMGLRAIEDSGIVLPMFKQLGIPMEYVKSRVSVGIEDKVIPIDSEASVDAYQHFLETFYPESSGEIADIIKLIKRIMKDMDVLYGIENPLFKDLMKDYSYILSTLLPWMFRFIFTIGRINRMNEPVESLLERMTANRALQSIIGQHFFKKTPAFFAMSYFSVYLDYLYPKGGTGKSTELLEGYVREKGSEIETGTSIVQIDPEKRSVVTDRGNTYQYKDLIWCADLNALYRAIDSRRITTPGLKNAVLQRAELYRSHDGGDSVFSLFLSVDRPPEYFKSISEGHFFYTADRRGLGDIHTKELDRLLKEYRSYREDKQHIEEFITRYLAYTTYEISIPVLKDPAMAPEGKTGLIVSTLFDYSLLKRIDEEGCYEEFRDFCSDYIVKVLSKSIYPGLDEFIMDSFTSTPLTIERITGNKMGAITGWAFSETGVPAVHQMQKVAQSVKTPFSHIHKAGQWTYSPSGLPIAFLTGKLAADRVGKKQKR